MSNLCLVSHTYPKIILQCFVCLIITSVLAPYPQLINNHRDVIIGHLITICIFLGFHSFSLYIHNDTFQALGHPSDIFSDTAIQLKPVFATFLQQIFFSFDINQSSSSNPRIGNSRFSCSSHPHLHHSCNIPHLTKSYSLCKNLQTSTK
jgi:Photosystem I psaA/psaB protein